jgi:hypothetical protein
MTISGVFPSKWDDDHPWLSDQYFSEVITCYNQISLVLIASFQMAHKKNPLYRRLTLPIVPGMWSSKWVYPAHWHRLLLDDPERGWWEESDWMHTYHGSDFLGYLGLKGTETSRPGSGDLFFFFLEWVAIIVDELMSEWDNSAHQTQMRWVIWQKRKWGATVVMAADGHHREKLFLLVLRDERCEV